MAKEKTKAELEAELVAVYETLEQKDKKIKKLEALLKKDNKTVNSKVTQH